MLLPLLLLVRPPPLHPAPPRLHPWRRLLRALPPPAPRLLRLLPQDIPVQPHHGRLRRHHPPLRQAQPHPLRQEPRQENDLQLRSHLPHRLLGLNDASQWNLPGFPQQPQQHHHHSFNAVNAHAGTGCGLCFGSEVGPQEEKRAAHQDLDGYNGAGEAGEDEEQESWDPSHL